MLRAVLSLGEGALYPFNALSVSVLLLEKQPRAGAQPWLFNIMNDGYPRRRSRDIITQEPGPDNDLPLVVSALRLRGADMQSVPLLGNPARNSFFSIAPLAAEETSSTVGFAIRVTEQAILASIWLIEEQFQEQMRRYFL